MTNENKIDFIICYNNDLYLQECISYISMLVVPEGIETEILSIAEAESMAAGYNAAMNESNAKYKVYLHQDLFIVNKNFIADVLRIFKENPDYGMLGVLGRTEHLENANYWNAWNTGPANACNILKIYHIFTNNPKELTSVTAIDGMLMVTQYDVKWREDVFKGFDFYDISQSMEFLKKGYKIGVMPQDTVWYIHDCGHSNMANYDDARMLFCNEYGALGYKYSEVFTNTRNKTLTEQINYLLPLLEKNMLTVPIQEASIPVKSALESYLRNTRLCILWLVCEIALTEQSITEHTLQNNNSTDCKNTAVSSNPLNNWNTPTGITSAFFRGEDTLQGLIDKIMLYRFLLYRLDFNKPVDDLKTVIEWVAENEYKTLPAAGILAQHTVADVDRVMSKLNLLIKEV